MDNLPTINTANAGSTIPLKWALSNAAGNAYVNMSGIQAITSKQIRCPNGTTDPVNPPICPIGTTGIAGVTAGVFHFNWATLRTWSGTCRRLYVHLSDGSNPYAEFQFR